ncbi:MAG TPA: (Fe-S)-binding protein, partial [Chitinivibrionales bacterium]|nr:(Fe-S)-binding protein [Chitinivibrionales bacterium]
MAAAVILLSLGILGLLSGAALGAGSALFLKHDDAVAGKIRLVLPEVDCGACGFETCEEFAKAVAGRKS